MSGAEFLSSSDTVNQARAGAQAARVQKTLLINEVAEFEGRLHDAIPRIPVTHQVQPFKLLGVDLKPPDEKGGARSQEEEWHLNSERR